MGLRVRASSLLLSLALELAVALVSGNSVAGFGRSLLACIVSLWILRLLARALPLPAIALAVHQCRVRLSSCDVSCYIGSFGFWHDATFQFLLRMDKDTELFFVASSFSVWTRIQGNTGSSCDCVRTKNMETCG